MRYLTQTLNTSVKRWLARRLHAGPFTYCYVEILLVDVAPIGRPLLITGNDARFCVTISFFFLPSPFQVVVHGILLCLVHALYTPSEGIQDVHADGFFRRSGPSSYFIVQPELASILQSWSFFRLTLGPVLIH